MLVLRSRRVVLPEGERAAALHIAGGIIERIHAFDSSDPAGAVVLNVPDLVVSPGVVDTHVHVNEPGRTEWEGFDTATRAAAAGGVTTLVDMPLNSIPATTSVGALRAKLDAARANCHVDVGFWGGVVPGNADQLEPLIDAGVRGFKCFLVPSGVDEFAPVAEDDLRRALPILARRRVPLLVHAESPALILSPETVAHRNGALDGDEGRGVRPGVYVDYLATRPAAAELDAIRLMIRLAEEFRTRVHIVHVSSAEGVAAIGAARTAWVPITAETCPHYLTFAADEIADGETAFKCAPPIREAAHRRALWDGLAAGTLDLIATDHSPSPPPLKTPGDFVRAWGGIASLELSLPAVWTAYLAAAAEPRRPSATPEPSELPMERGVPAAALVDLARWMSAAPAALAGLTDRKGRIAEGLDADLVVWDPDIEFRVEPATLQQRHKLTPYAGRSLFGRVVTTFVRGEAVWEDNRLARAYRGRLL